MSCYLQFSLACLVFSLSLTSTGSAQRLTAATSDRNLLPYGGILKGPDNAPIADRTVSLTFSIYQDRNASVPPWRETQSVSTDAKGNYAVVLGAPTAAGLPADLFPPGEQRWLGVQILGGLEQ